MLESRLHFDHYHQVHRALRHLGRTTGALLSPIQRSIVLDEHVAVAALPTETIGRRDAQSEAIRQAIAQPLTLIHGPPGTGKTHVGLQIVRQLLLDDSTPPRRLLVVVCATNQALDHFLYGVHGIAAAHPQLGSSVLVRMGAQSKDARLDAYNVRHLSRPLNARLAHCLWSAKQQIVAANERLHGRLLGLRRFVGEVVDADEPHRLVRQIPVLRHRLAELEQLSDALAIRSGGARVIGMTSASAARRQTLIALLRADTVVVEEAAAMLEAHVMVALTGDTRRLVLIGECQRQASSEIQTALICYL